MAVNAEHEKVGSLVLNEVGDLLERVSFDDSLIGLVRITQDLEHELVQLVGRFGDQLRFGNIGEEIPEAAFDDVDRQQPCPIPLRHPCRLSQGAFGALRKIDAAEDVL